MCHILPPCQPLFPFLYNLFNVPAYDSRSYFKKSNLTLVFATHEVISLLFSSPALFINSKNIIRIMRIIYKIQFLLKNIINTNWIMNWNSMFLQMFSLLCYLVITLKTTIIPTLCMESKCFLQYSYFMIFIMCPSK